jgi:predicted N-acyltransferase
MTHTCEVYSAGDAALEQTWNLVAEPSDDVFMDLRLLSAMQQGGGKGDQFWAAIVRDERQQIVGKAFLSVITLDLAMMAGGLVQRVVQGIRTGAKNFLKYRAIVCGLPVSAGQSHLWIDPQSDADAVLSSLANQMRRTAKPVGARFLILKEFATAATTLRTALERQQFFIAESPPMNLFPAEFASLENYMAALKAPYRSKIVRSQRKSADLGLRAETIVSDGERIASQFTEETHGLYLAVVERSAVKLEVLSREWFQAMARRFSEESVWLAIYDGDRLLAWAYGLRYGNEYHSLFGGVNYALNENADAYFNLTYHELDFALGSGATDIHLGQTADDFKSRLGAVQSPRWFALKPLRWKAKVVLNLAAEQVLPKFPPAPERHVFHAAHAKPPVPLIAEEATVHQAEARRTGR